MEAQVCPIVINICFSKEFKEPAIYHTATGRPHAENEEADQCERQTDQFVDVPLIKRRYYKESDETRKHPNEVQYHHNPNGRACNEALDSERGEGRPARLQKATDSKIRDDKSVSTIIYIHPEELLNPIAQQGCHPSEAP